MRPASNMILIGQRQLRLVRRICIFLCGLFIYHQVSNFRQLVSSSEHPHNSDLPFFLWNNMNMNNEHETPVHHRPTKAKTKTKTNIAADAAPINRPAVESSSKFQVQTSSTTKTANEINNNKNTNNTPRGATNADSSSFVVDILSIGSVNRLDYLEAQKKSFASHISVRNFFTATELDDADPHCASKLSSSMVDDLQGISNFCKMTKPWDRKQQWMIRWLVRNLYAVPAWLQKKANPSGWMCAQSRPPQAFYNKVVQYYRAAAAAANSSNSTGGGGESSSSSSLLLSTLPDYLIIMDDDTYYNMELFQQHFEQKRKKYTPAEDRDSSQAAAATAVVVAGCLIRQPIQQINLTMPWGGFGVIMNQGALANMMRPIYCDRERDRERERDAELCKTMQQDGQLEEHQWFRDGMSLADLLYAYATKQPFDDHKNWTTGYCVHSDWLWGILFGIYNISSHGDTNPIFANVPQMRLAAYMGSEAYAGDDSKPGRRLCDHVGDYCHSYSHACHQSTPDLMMSITDTVRRRVPHKFRTPVSNDSAAKLDVSVSSKPPISATRPTTGTVPRKPFVVDIVSIGSLDRPEYHKAQKTTLGSHASVRKFWEITEADTADRDCETSLSSEDITTINDWCQDKWQSSKRKNYWSKKNRKLLREGFTDARSVCQQTRPVHGLYKALQQYGPHDSLSFPDYLFLMEDDTYVNLDLFQDEFYTRHNSNISSSVPWVLAGCIDFNQYLHLTAASVGFGILLSRGSLERLRQPIYCKEKVREDELTSSTCHRLEESRIGELSVFQEGMSLIDLWNGLVNHQPFSLYANWTIGMCMNSKWFMGYILNMYNVASHVDSPYLESHIEFTNVEPYLKSRVSNRKGSVPRLCFNQGPRQCHSEVAVCDGIPPDAMLQYTSFDGF